MRVSSLFTDSRSELTWSESESESESELLYDWQFTANHFLETSPLRLTTSKFIFQLNTCGYIPYVTSSLMRGSFCHLQLLLALVSTLMLRSESRGIHDHILQSQIRDYSNLESWVPVFISPRNKVAQLYPQALDSLFVAFYAWQVEGFDPASTRVAPVVFKITPQHGPRRNTPLPRAPLLLRVDSLLRERVYRAVA
jgi:hypothetical protein